MSAKSFNEDWQTGQKAAGERLPALKRKYQTVLRKNAKTTAERYRTVTAAAKPDDPSELVDENGLKVSITARTAAERKRMAKAVATPLVGSQKPGFFESIVAPLASAQAEAAVKAVRDALNATIANALEEGWSVPETADRIQETLTEYADWEAERLARSDLVSISNSTSLKAAQSLGDAAPKFKRWLSAGDDRVREDHRVASGQTVPIGETFDVGGFPMDHPGDWLAPYDQWINCRCVPIYLDDAEAKAAHSFEGGIVEDPIAIAADDAQEAMAAAGFVEGKHQRWQAGVHTGGQFKSLGAIKAAEEKRVDEAVADVETIEEPVAQQPLVQRELDSGGSISDTERSKARRALSFSPDEALATRVAKATSWDDLGEADRSSLAALLEDAQDETDHEDLQPLIDRLRKGKSSDALPRRGDYAVTAASVDFTAGSMIALYPDDPEALAAEDGQPAGDLHVTLAFLPEGVDGDREALVEILRAVASGTSVLEGNVGGMGMFAAGPDGKPVIALPDVVGLNELRTAVVSALQISETTYATSHGFCPHITIGYVDEGGEMDTPDLLGSSLTFYALALVEGPERTEFAFSSDLTDTLEGVDELSAAIEDETFPPQDEELGASVEEDLGTPVAAIVYERETLHKGKRMIERRMMVPLPAEYDGVTAARQAGLNGLTAAAAPLAPPDEWFEDPGFDQPTPLTVTADGRVMGHLGEWGKCHTGFGGRCVPVPRSMSNYADFHTGGLVTASGKEIRVGRITVDTGHAPVRAGGAKAAIDHYDNTGNVGAFVRAGEDQFGPWLAGAVRSDATPEMIRNLRANPPSGDWRKLYGRNNLELVAALAVPVQGFPVASLTASGDVEALFAGFCDSDELALVAALEQDEGLALDEIEREWEYLTARLDGMDGLAALVAAPIDEGRADYEMGLLAARLEGIDGLASRVAPGVTIENSTVVFNIGVPEAESMDIGDDELDAEIAYQVDFFNNYGYWPDVPQSGADLSDEQMKRVQMLAPLMVSDPSAPTSVAIRDRLVRKGLLYSKGG